MSPQAKQTEEAPGPFEVLLKRVSEIDADDRTSAERQIFRAGVLERERSDLMKRVDANRKYLRLMEQNEELTEEEADAVDDFYPQKEKGERRTDEEVSRTRRAKEAARKAGS